MALHESLCETPAMANMAVETLSHMYALARGWDMAPEDCDDPCEFIPMNPKRKRERFLTDTEFTRLGHVLDEVSGKGSRISAGAIATIRLLMLTGCRRNEILTLRWEHVDLDKAEMRIVDGKTGARMVHLSPSAVRVLEALPPKPGSPWVIPGAKPGTHMTDIDGSWEAIRVRAGLHDVRIHDIRHRFTFEVLSPPNICAADREVYERRGSCIHHLAYIVADMPGAFQRIADTGVPCAQEPSFVDKWGMWLGFLHDPDGNCIELFNYVGPHFPPIHDDPTENQYVDVWGASDRA